MEKIKWLANAFKQPILDEPLITSITEKNLQKSFHFHSSIPGYEPTPLHSLSYLAEHLGVGAIYVKDESRRFGLNSFKGLGGSFAMATYFAKELNQKILNVSYPNLRELVMSLPKRIFATATDGNHGKGVAWGASLFGHGAIVYMPKGSSKHRLDAINGLGADAFITDLNYDDTVRLVSRLVKENNWILIQDTAWEDYTEIPMWIMQGYLTIADEINHQLKAYSEMGITHVFLQAGVGSFAAAISAFLHERFSHCPPITIIVEPTRADCLYKSALTSDGLPKRVFGDLSTMMAGLACGEPNPVAWQVLKSIVDYFFSCPDIVAARGMRILGNPLGGDPRIIAGESGAVTTGLLYELVQNSIFEHLRTILKLDESSRILLINTEGDTDPKNYRRIVWDGLLSYGD